MLRCIRFYFKNPTKPLPIGKRLRSIGFLLDSLILQLLNIRCNLWLDQISMDFDFRISSCILITEVPDGMLFTWEKPAVVDPSHYIMTLP